MDGILSIGPKVKDKAKIEEFKRHIRDAKAHLDQKVKKPRHQPLDPNNLPHRTAKPTKRKPRMTKEAFLRDFGMEEAGKVVPVSYNGRGIPGAQFASHPPNEDLPTAADLAENIEVQFTPEIKAKAAELEHNPVKIYNWVRNNIDFVPTYGSIQGANHCLLTKQCNDMDTASLLIALLRTSGIPARYVMGTIKLPIDKVMNWVGGFTNEQAALNFIASAGTPVAGVVSGGNIVIARMEHVWAEAYVGYIPSRGVVPGAGDTWIPLDASYKQNSFVEGIDVNAASPIDVEALHAEVVNQTMTNSDIPTVTGLPADLIQTQISDFQVSLKEYLAANFPEVNTFRELDNTLHGYREIIQKNLRFLPNTLPVRVVAQSAAFNEISANRRHAITFKVSGTDFLFEETSFLYTTYLPAIVGKRITFSYTPATAADAQVMSDAEGIIGFPLYLVEVIPELKIDGQIVASGNAIGMGRDQSFEMVFNNPIGLTDQVSNTILAGEYYGIGIDASKVTFPYLNERVNRWQPDIAEDRDDRIGELLFLLSMLYFAKSDFFMEEAEKAIDIVSIRHPSESMVGMKINPGYLFDIPKEVAGVNLGIDVDRDILSPSSQSGNRDTEFWFMVQNGLNASGQEHDLFESLMELDAISAVRAIELANSQLVPIYIIDSGNAQRIDELQLLSDDKRDIRNFVSAGRTVLVPKVEIQHFDYSGIGYIALDLNTGAGAYRISGGFNGGDTVRENTEALLDMAKELFASGPGGLATYRGYEERIIGYLKSLGERADSEDSDFKVFTELWLYNGTQAKRKGIPARKVLTGQEIVKHLEIMLFMLAEQ